MAESDEDSLIASYSRNRSKWQSDSSKFTPKGILPRETKPLPAATMKQVMTKGESKPVDIEDKSIILNYHINRSRWQNDSSKFTPKGILPIDSSPLIGRRPIPNSTYTESNRVAGFLNDDRSVFSTSSRRDGPTETELSRSTMNNNLLRNGEISELVESLDIVPQYSFYAEYFGQDESVKSLQIAEQDDVLDNTKGDMDSLNGTGKMRPASNMVSAVNTSEEGEWNKIVPPRQQKYVKELSNDKISSSVNKNTVEYHRIFAERTEERNRPTSIVARGRSKTPPTRGVQTIDKRDISKENILLYVDDTLRGPNVVPSSLGTQSLHKDSVTLQQHNQVQFQEESPAIAMEIGSQGIKSEDDTLQYTGMKFEYSEDISHSKETTSIISENLPSIRKCDNNGTLQETDKLNLSPNSVEDYVARSKLPFDEQKDDQVTITAEEQSSETHTTQKDEVIINGSLTNPHVVEKVLQMDGQQQVDNIATYSPDNGEYMAFSKSSDDEPIFIEESDFHSTDEDCDKLEHSVQIIDDIVASRTKYRGSCETSGLVLLREDIDRLNTVESESNSPNNNNKESLIGGLNLSNIEEVNEDSSSPVVEPSLDHSESGSDSLLNQFDEEPFIQGTAEVVSSVDLNDTIEKLDYFGCTLMNSMNEEGIVNSHDRHDDEDIGNKSLMEEVENKKWKADKQKEDNDFNITFESTTEINFFDGNPPNNDCYADREKISTSRLLKSTLEKDSLFDTDVILCDATTVSSFTDDERPSASKDPNKLAPDLQLSKHRTESLEGLNVGSSFSKNTTLKADSMKSYVQSSESEKNLGSKENQYPEKVSLLKENMLKLNEARLVQSSVEEKHLVKLKLNTNVYSATPERFSRKKFQKGVSSQTTRVEHKNDPVLRTYTTRVKGEKDFLLAELLAVSASKIVLADESKCEGVVKKVIRPHSSSVHAATSDAIDAPMDEINSNIKGSQAASTVSESVAEEDVTMSKCVDEMKQFWDWAAKYAKEENTISHFSSPHTISKSEHAVAAEEGAWESFGGAPELDRCLPLVVQNEAKLTQSSIFKARSIGRSVKPGENTTGVPLYHKNNSVLPTSLANSIQQTSSKRETAKSNIIVLSGNILARTSFKTIFMKKWKHSFWIQFEAKLMLFRSMEDFKHWKCSHASHPSDASRTKHANQHDSLVKFRIDFLEEMSRPGMRGFRATDVKSKVYQKGGPLIYNFKLEKWHDLGPSLLAVFASDKPEEIGFLRHAVDECLQKCPENGLRSINDLLVSGKVLHH